MILFSIYFVLILNRQNISSYQLKVKPKKKNLFFLIEFLEMLKTDNFFCHWQDMIQLRYFYEIHIPLWFFLPSIIKIFLTKKQFICPKKNLFSENLVFQSSSSLIFSVRLGFK